MNIEKTLLWDITYECNLRCVHCYNSKKVLNSDESIIERENINEILDRIKLLGVNHIHLLGGEPMILNSIFHMLDEINKRNMIVTINTNGTLLDEDVLPRLFQTDIAQITISLDGVEKEQNDAIRGKGTFDCIIKNTKKLTEFINSNGLQTKVQIATVVTKQNYKNIYKLPRFIKTLGVDYLNILKLYEQGNAEKNETLLSISKNEYLKVLREILIESYRNSVYVQIDCKPKVLQKINMGLGLGIEISSEFNACKAGDKILFMDAYGNIYPCGPYSQIENGADTLKCNILDEDFVAKVNTYKSEIEKNIMKNKFEDDLCYQCEFSKQCSSCAICGDGNSLCYVTCHSNF